MRSYPGSRPKPAWIRTPVLGVVHGKKLETSQLWLKSTILGDFQPVGGQREIPVRCNPCQYKRFQRVGDGDSFAG